jgi:CMP-N-acetylneuraminic acid synthetase
MLAREGSKRLPGKNRLDWFGKPLWLHALDVALACASVMRVDLVTDMAIDFTEVGEWEGVVWHKPMPNEHTSIEGVEFWREQAEYNASYCLLIQCTSPFINPDDLDRLVSAAFADGLPTCVWALGDPDDTHPKLLEKGIRGRPSGMGYVIPPLATDTIARRIVKQDAPMIDIDTKEDYERARDIYRERQGVLDANTGR